MKASLHLPLETITPTADTRTFSAVLQAWSAVHPRPMPWRGERDAYRVWLSEIILQQTRVAQGLPYYERFLAAYPRVIDLAAAPAEEVMRCWQGLGYYSRARNLHAAAKYIADTLNGTFPSTYEDIRALRGVGDYTAAAIASFAYNLPYAVVDGNVYRVLSRLFGIATPIDSTAGKREFAALANAVLDPHNAAAHNQAFMDFGATCCTPAAPACPRCPFVDSCVAFRQNKVPNLPVKAKKMATKIRYFNYFIFGNGQQIWLQKRGAGDIWQDLHQFPMIETEAACEVADLAQNPEWQLFFGESQLRIESVFVATQQLTHQTIKAKFYTVENNFTNILPKNNAYFLIKPKNIANFALPKIITTYFENRTLSLF